MPASVWSGYLTFGLISMPVRLYSGARGSRVSFHMLHRPDLTRVKQLLFCPNDEKVIERKDIVKGYEYQKGEYVIVEPEEIKKIEPKTAKAMEILEFVKQEEIDPVFFESSYYLVPQDPGRKPYALLARALQESAYVAIAKLAMHNREYTVFLRPYHDGLMLHTMYYQDEIRAMPGSGHEHGKLKDSELKVAHQLIHALAAKWDPAKYYDAFEQNVKKLIKAKVEGKEVTPVPKPQRLAPPTDLIEALKSSLAQMQSKKKGPQRVESPTRPTGTKSKRKQAA